MLDLNVDLASAETKITTEEKLACGEDYGTSNSSVVNSADEDSSSILHNISSYNFGILTGGRSIGNVTEIEDDCNENSPPELVTRQLFPVAGGGGVGDSQEFGSLLRPAQWLNLNLSCPDSGGGGELTQSKKFQPQKQQVKKSRRGPTSRSSQYRGVTFYRRTGRWESHIWDCGKQVYLGGFDTAHAAARAYDQAAIKFRGVDADINFNITDYKEDMIQIDDLSKEEFVQILRRRSTGFNRGSSKYRGVTLHKCGRWEARMGQFLGKKAYDKAAIICNGREAVTNFDASTYEGKISSDANNPGGNTVRDLDLNLWISPPTDVPERHDNARYLQLPCAACEMPYRKRPKVHSSVFPAPMESENTHGLTMASKHPPIWPGIYPSFTPNYEEAASGKAEGAISSPALSNSGISIVL